MTRLLILLLLAGPAAAQTDLITIRGESPQTRKRLTEVQQLLLDGKATADTPAALQKLLDDAGDDLVSLDNKHLVPARRLVHSFLAKLPAELLDSYRTRIDPPARELLAAAQKDRDPQPLRQLLDRYFVSRPGEEALDLLGELLFERGDFRAAEAAWRQLTPDPIVGDAAYPSPRGDLASVRARIALAVLFAGDTERATTLIESVKKEFPNATGVLAGKNAKYADTLAALLANPPRPAVADLPGWHTLGGSPNRDGRVGAKMPFYVTPRPAWTADIPTDSLAAFERYPTAPPPVGAARSVAFHPVVLGGKAYLADAGRVIAFDLKTGKARVVADIRRDDRLALLGGELTAPTRFEADYALSVADGVLFARLGSAVLAPKDPIRFNERRSSTLLALRPSGETLATLWTAKPPALEGIPTVWEGAPVAVGGRVVAAYLRFDAGRTIHAAAGLDAADGRILWTTDLSEPAAANDSRTRHELLSVAGPLVVACTHTGAVVALDAKTGKPAWAYRYTRRTPNPRTDLRHRDINPPSASGGRVFVAPTDGENLLALDADTGRLLWQSPALEIDHILGIANGKVIAAVAGPQRGIRGFDVRTGSTDAPHGWQVHDDPQLSSFGRGLVWDDMAVWPTHAGLYFVRTADGMPARQPVRGPHGNLAFADGVLLVGTPRALWGYVADPSRVPPSSPAVVVGGVLPGVVPPALASTTVPKVTLPLGVESERRKPEDAVDDPFSPSVRAGGRVVGRIGENHLAAVDAVSGKVAWVLDAQKRPQYDRYADWPTFRFLPYLAAADGQVLAYPGGGRRWVIDAADGRVRHDQAAPPADYVGRPVRLPGGLFAASAGLGLIGAIDPVSGQEKWQFDAGRPASLTGEPIVARGIGTETFVAVPRNLGMELDRLTPLTGRRLWPEPLPLPAGFDVDAMDVHRGAGVLAVPVGSVIRGVRLDTGATAWETPIPAANGWRCVATESGFLAIPTEGIAQETFADVWSRVGRALLRSVARLPGVVGTLYDAWGERTLPVLALDPATGRELGRLTLPAVGPAVRVRSAEGRVVIETATMTYRMR